MEVVVKHTFKKYDATEKFDRICVLLRRDDFETLRANHPHGVSHWIRQCVASHVDYLRAKQRKAARQQRNALMAGMRDPNL
jgi:hypothetical protein